MHYIELYILTHLRNTELVRNMVACLFECLYLQQLISFNTTGEFFLSLHDSGNGCEKKSQQMSLDSQ